jgi:hypothetical protein
MVLGIVINIIGACLAFTGILISFTGIGAIIGLPMVCCVGFPMAILGTVMFWQGRAQMSQEAIARGIQAGIAVARTPSQIGIQPLPMIQPPVSTTPSGGKVCAQCGTLNPSEYAFCGNCGSPLKNGSGSRA